MRFFQQAHKTPNLAEYARKSLRDWVITRGKTQKIRGKEGYGEKMGMEMEMMEVSELNSTLNSAR